MPTLTLEIDNKEAIEIITQHFSKDYIVKGASFYVKNAMDHVGISRQYIPASFCITLRVEKREPLHLPGIPGY